MRYRYTLAVAAFALLPFAALGQIDLFDFYTESRAYTGVRGVGVKTESDLQFNPTEAIAEWDGPDNESIAGVGTSGALIGDAFVGLHAGAADFSTPSISGQQATGFGQFTAIFGTEGTYDLGGILSFDFETRAPFWLFLGYEVYDAESEELLLADSVEFFRPLDGPVDGGSFELEFDNQSYDFDADSTYLLQTTLRFSADRGFEAFGFAGIIGEAGEPVPEPMTLAVLGLGALALRRRRK
jgi:hypothetical protein